MTLADLNANAAATRWTWSDTYVLETRWVVGRSGKPSQRGRTGDHLHLIRQTIIVEDVRGAGAQKSGGSCVARRRSGEYGVGDVFGATGSCGGNGQITAFAVAGKDLADVTCSKCLKAVAGFQARFDAQQEGR